MTSGGFLVPPSEKPEGSEIWEETWKRVDRFLPDLFAEIFPEAKESATSATAVPKTGTEGNPPPLVEPLQKENTEGGE